MADTDPVAAKLSPIRERVAACDDGFSPYKIAFVQSAGDVPVLLAAVDKALALADDWQRKAETNRRLLAKWNNPHYTIPLEAETKQLEQCAEALRSAVLAGLTGKGENGG